MPQSSKIFLTGASGFIGSHLAELLIKQGFQLMALKRSNTDLWRCEGFLEQIIWIDEKSLGHALTEFKPNVIIHLGWTGINHIDRENWELQFSNFEMLFDLIRIGKLISVQKFIAFGSQAEYGWIQGRVDETIVPRPNNAYAVAKIATQQAIQIACEQNRIQWYWLRIYSIFGPREDKNWFVPMIINNLLNDIDCKLTGCEQQYDYLYVKDLAKMVLTIIDGLEDRSGIYNLSSNSSKSLRSIVTRLNEMIPSSSTISFGEVPYRINQSMHIEGNSDLYNKVFGEYPLYDFDRALEDTINYYKEPNSTK
jgi:nucleoside-diphosphate-sugar epimerase